MIAMVLKTQHVTGLHLIALMVFVKSCCCLWEKLR